ncbi:MAG: tetratricopeptide repeat protein [Woeseiaceae bacterium]
MTYRLTFLILFSCLATGGQSLARDIHYGAIGNTDLLRCDRLAWTGKQNEARTCYQQLLVGEAMPEVKAEAAWALGDLQSANAQFRLAASQRPDSAAIRVRWGDLFADSHQDGEAMNIYREALELDGVNPFARLGAARLLVGGFDDAANSFLEPLLTDQSVAAGARAAAWLLVARVSLENSNYAQAEEALNSAETLLRENDWPLLELYALRAAADLLDNVTESRYTQLSLQENPGFGDIYAIPAHFYVITRRYREAIDLYQMAVDIQPDHAAAHEELGVNLLRDNQMSRARKHLETAYKVDPFSPKAVNTLRLLDSFEDFDLINDPATPEPGILPIVFRLHRDESAAILPYALELARDSILEFTQRYGFELKEPVVIEMYPDHEDFAVRTAGMPGIGILGATFGYVVAMDSPSGRPPEQFQWGTTLWHEMAHVFTLEATNHLVPRWFSEGVSVFEEWRSGPNQGVRIPMSVYTAMADDRFLPVAELDEGFIRPTYEEQVIVSYMQAGLVCQHIDEAYGTDKLRALLYAFRDGLQTGEAIEAVLEMTPAAYDKEFEQFVKDGHGEILGSLEEWQRTQQSIANHIEASEWASIVELANHLIDILPQYVEPDSPYLALAKAQEEMGNHEAAVGALETYWRQGGYSPASLQRLAGWLREAGRPGDAIDVYKSVNLVDPLGEASHAEFGDLLLEQNRAEEALREFGIALALNPHDKASAYYRMARAQHALGNNEQSQVQLLRALDVAPNYRPAQRLLLEVMRTEQGN